MREYIKDIMLKIWDSPPFMVATYLYMSIGIFFLTRLMSGKIEKLFVLVAGIFFILFAISFIGFMYREFKGIYHRLGMYFAMKNQRNLYKKYQISLKDAAIQKEQKEFWQDRYMREEYEKKYWQKLYFTKKSKEGFSSLTKKELKSVYKKAANLCHPDKVKYKDEGEKIFSELQNAYDNRDSQKVIGIFINLTVGRYNLN